MNAIITQYKKIGLLAIAAIAMNINVAVLADCSPCAVAAAARSAAAAQAALIVAGKQIAREAEVDELPSTDSSRAPHGQLYNPYSECELESSFNSCDLNSKLQTLFNCCVATNQQVRCQGEDAEKCCKKLRHKIGDVEDQVFVIEELIISQTDAAAACCSVIEGLIISQTDAAATCCSVTGAQIAALNASVAAVFVLLTSVWDCTCDF